MRANSHHPDDDLPARLERVLELTNSATDLHFTTYGERWRLLVQALLGHPPIKGMQRPRDFPMGEHRAETLALANLLHLPGGPEPIGGERAARPATHRQLPVFSPPYRLYDWVAAFAIIVAAKGWDDESPGYAAAMVSTVKRLLEMSEPDGNKREPLEWHMFEAIGLNGRQRDVATKLKFGGIQVADDVELATLAAAIAFPDANQIEAGPDRLARLRETLVAAGWDGKRTSRAFDQLERVPVSFVIVQIHHVQQFLRRCRQAFAMRGASVWCCQTLSMLRDALLTGSLQDIEVTPGNLVLLSDAEVLFSVVSSTNIEIEQIKRGIGKFYKRLEGGDALKERYPRLEKWIERAQDEGVPLRSAMPALKISVSHQTNLLQFASEVPDTAPRGVNHAEIPEFVTAAEVRVEGGDCLGRDGDRGLDTLPPWMEPGKAPGGSLGWPAAAYSLVGSVHKARASLGFRRELKRRDLIVPSNRTTMFWALRLPKEEGISHVRIDGDAVSQMFRSRATLARGWLSIRFAQAIRERLLRGVESALAAGEKCCGRPVMPIDLVFLGGDDLALYLPARFLEAFLRAFAAANTKPDIGDRYTYTALSFRRADDDDNTLTRAALVMLPTILKMVKASKGMPSEAHLSALAIREGMTVSGGKVQEVNDRLRGWSADLGRLTSAVRS